MCDLMTAITVGATLYSGYTQKRQGDAQAKVARQTAAYNSRLQENEATRTRNIGTEEENKQRRMTAELLSQQRAQIGASGVVGSSGSALQLQQDTASLGETDALRIRSNYADQAGAMEQGAALTKYEGAAKSSALKAEGKAAFTGAILSSAGTVAGKWYSPKSSAVQAGGGNSFNNTQNISGGGNIHSTSYLRSQRV